MVDFINEVEEELRKDDYNKFLRQYGPFILGLIIAVILFASYLEFTKGRKDRQSRAISAAYVAAGEAAARGDIDQSIKEFSLIADKSPAGYAGLSLMRAGALEVDRGNFDAAISLFEQAAGRFETRRHKDIASLKASYLFVAQDRYSDAILRTKLLSEADAPYEFLSRELLALALLKSGDVEAAKSEYSYLENIPGVPPTIAQRAKQAMDLMRVNDALTPDVAGVFDESDIDISNTTDINDAELVNQADNEEANGE